LEFLEAAQEASLLAGAAADPRALREPRTLRQQLDATEHALRLMDDAVRDIDEITRSYSRTKYDSIIYRKNHH
jgi:hypothetical protein